MRVSATITFPLTDIEAISQLWEQHPEMMDGAVARHDELWCKAIRAYEGHVFRRRAREPGRFPRRAPTQSRPREQSPSPMSPIASAALSARCTPPSRPGEVCINRIDGTEMPGSPVGEFLMATDPEHRDRLSALDQLTSQDQDLLAKGQGLPIPVIGRQAPDQHSEAPEPGAQSLPARAERC
jgi:hypothetical protein